MWACLQRRRAVNTERTIRWSAGAVAGVGVAYVFVLGIGIARFGTSRPIEDPVLAWMEVLTICSAWPLVSLVAAIDANASAEKRTLSALALVSVGLFAGITTAVHFIGLTAGRQLGDGRIVWPSTSYAAELLAWDLLLGVALVFVALASEVEVVPRGERRGMIAAGVLCLVGTIGPAIGDMRLQRIGVIGYALVLPITCALLARGAQSELAMTTVRTKT